ncbi:flagellar motor switch protein FliN [Kushneria phosphatilytica]|uniref:Flagellar motor switch protein FliN n=1 Tax=Kushneria phosphatilytica TaxID=657387 RepID=A0A1S1NRX4_9GAMM|nr:flagellar motor switch protein FliN [Kushneria phosphatilytica]OHV12014.1 flagellar motor switch protein FliN [Kushneria phosphatilytica]QEL11204.1 flagellar motor switch protein FliN [Kushneria phosphatilytica]
MSDTNKPEDENNRQTDPTEDGGSAADDWADAFAEQQAEEGHGAPEEDPWAAAMAEQGAAEESSDTGADTQDASESVFKPLTGEAPTGERRDLDMIMEIPVTLSVELGRTRLTIRELLDLAKGSVVELDGLAGEPMNILINGYLVAQGEVVVVDDKYGIRVTDIITPSERIHKLSR